MPWRKAVKYAIYSELILLCFFTGLLGNLFSTVTGRGYFIPYHSSMFAFFEDEVNIGSGEWWLYGRDKRHYYAWIDYNPPTYLYIPRNNTCKGFVRNDLKTWCPEETGRGIGGWELKLGGG